MTGPINTTMSGREWGLLAALSIVWGGSFFFVSVAVDELPPLTIVAARVGLAAAALLLVARWRGLRPPSERRVLGAFLVMGALNNALPFALIVWAQARIPSGLAAVLNATTPLWAVLLAHLATTDERLTPARLGGVALGIAGVAVLLGGAAGGVLEAPPAAQLACLLAALSYALAGVYGRRFRAMGVAPLATATGQLVASSLLLLPLVLLLERPWALPLPSAATLLAILALALVSTALAYLVYFRLLASAGATNLLLVTILVPPSAILLGALFLGERPTAGQLASLGLIGAGLAVIDGRPAPALRRALRRALRAGRAIR